MPRDYRELLEVAQDLQEFRGYLDTIALKEQAQVQGRFNDARRKFVYAALREEADKRAVLPSVLAELDGIEAANPYLGAALSYVREELARDIDKQARSSALQRFLIRWGPPVLTAVAAGAYIYFQSTR